VRWLEHEGRRRTLPSTTERASRIGQGFVPKWWIVAFTFILLLLAGFLLYSIWQLWPSGLSKVSDNPERLRVSYFGTSFTESTDTLFFAIVALAGALGGLVHTLRSFSMYVGTRYLRWSWIPFNLLLPVVGALGGTVFYLVFRGGLFSTSTSASDANPFGFAAIAALVGLFSEQAIEKLRHIAKEMFAEAPRYEPDHYKEAAGETSPGGGSGGSSGTEG
jgi:ABC-type Fe3+ transport system permease subunit